MGRLSRGAGKDKNCDGMKDIGLWKGGNHFRIYGIQWEGNKKLWGNKKLFVVLYFGP